MLFRSELSHKQVGRYDPTRPYFDAGEKWREVFWGRRKAYLENVADVPIAHLGYRLQLLQRGVEAAQTAKNWALLAELLEQAARAVGGIMPTQRNHPATDKRTDDLQNMTSDERRAALAAIVQRAMEAAPARLAAMQEGDRACVQ